MTRRAAALAALAMIFGGTGASAHLKVGDVAPRFTVDTFDKQKITSDQLTGQVVIINLWATWCGPCRQELPLIDAYYRLHAKDGLRVFAVTTEDSLPDSMLRKLSSVMAFPLTHRIAGHGFDELEGVPTNYVIDRQGVVRYAQAAAFDAQSLQDVIGPLLAEPVPATTASAAP